MANCTMERMDENTMKVIVEEWGFMPKRAHDTDAGLDLRSPIDFILPAGNAVTVSTGVHVQIPFGFAGMLKSKSGLNVKHGIQTEGVIDCGYTGCIAVKMYNHSDQDYEVKRGDKITQLVIVPVFTPDLVQVDSFEATERGNGGFGSTGR